MRLVAALALFLVLAPHPLTAQFGSAPRAGDEFAVSIGGRGLLDLDSGDPTLGLEARVHLPWPGFLQLRGAYDFTFLDGLTERTLMVDALLTNGGIAIGAGPVVRSTKFGPGEPRENLEGWSAVVALGGDPRADGRTSFGIELRLLFVDPFESRTVGVTFGLPIL